MDQLKANILQSAELDDKRKEAGIDVPKSPLIVLAEIAVKGNEARTNEKT